jgi:hypothetical protein
MQEGDLATLSMAQVETSTAVAGFAAALKLERESAKTALMLTWSEEHMEGHVHRAPGSAAIE